MKAISKVLGFLTYWLIEKEEGEDGVEEGEGNVEIVLGPEWLWIGIFLGFDFEAWIKLFEGWRGGKSGLKTWKKFDVCNGKVGRTFEKFKIIAYVALVFLDDEGSWGLTGVPIRMEKDSYPAKTPESGREFNSPLINSISKSKFENKACHLAKICFAQETCKIILWNHGVAFSQTIQWSVSYNFSCNKNKFDVYHWCAVFMWIFLYPVILW